MDDILLIFHLSKENVKGKDYYKKAYRLVYLSIASMKLKRKVQNIRFIFAAFIH